MLCLPFFVPRDGSADGLVPGSAFELVAQPPDGDEQLRA